MNLLSRLRDEYWSVQPEKHFEYGYLDYQAQTDKRQKVLNKAEALGISANDIKQREINRFKSDLDPEGKIIEAIQEYEDDMLYLRYYNRMPREVLGEWHRMYATLPSWRWPDKLKELVKELNRKKEDFRSRDIKTRLLLEKYEFIKPKDYGLPK